MRITIAALGLGLSLALATPAMAVTSPPPSVSAPNPEARALAREMVRLLFGKIDYKAMLTQHLGEINSAFGDMKVRPEWPDLAQQAALQESAELGDIIERRIGETLAGYFTLDELRAGIAFLRTPAGPELADMVAISARGEPQPEISAATKRELEKLARSPAGRGWLEKFSHIDKPMAAAEGDIEAAFVAGFLRHFLERVDQNEAARHPEG